MPAKFFELLRQLPDFAIHIVIVYKKLKVFNHKHNNSPSEFEFDLLHHLLKDCLHDAKPTPSTWHSKTRTTVTDFRRQWIKPCPRLGGLPAPVVSKLAIVLSSEYPERLHSNIGVVQ